MTRPGIRDVAQQHGLTVRGRAMACPRPEHEDRHPSVSIYDRGGTERWRCHRCGVGGDVYDLLGAVTGRDGRDVYRELARCSANGTAAPPPGNGAPRPARTWPTVAAAAGALARQHGGSVAGTWSYTDPEGTPVAAVVRVDRADGKTYRPLRSEGDGYAVGDPSGSWPLYRLRDSRLTARRTRCSSSRGRSALTPWRGSAWWPSPAPTAPAPPLRPTGRPWPAGA